MHSFHHSRGRILFDVFCAIAVSASLAGAWIQTGASALFGSAAISALYGFVHLFDVRRPADEQAHETEAPAQISVDTALPDPLPPAEAIVAAEPQRVEPAAPEAKPAGKAKAPRKSGGRRARAPKSAEVVQLAPQAEADFAEAAPTEEAEVEALFPAEDMHPHIAPLFEPEPFARMPRRAFGRKSG